MLKEQIESVYKTFLKPNNNNEIYYEKYDDLPDGIRLFKKASQVGRGFSFRSDVEIIRSFALQFGCHIDFIRKSTMYED